MTSMGKPSHGSHVVRPSVEHFVAPRVLLPLNSWTSYLSVAIVTTLVYSRCVWQPIQFALPRRWFAWWRWWWPFMNLKDPSGYDVVARKHVTMDIAVFYAGGMGPSSTTTEWRSPDIAKS